MDMFFLWLWDFVSNFQSKVRRITAQILLIREADFQSSSFPLAYETTAAATRLILSGVFDRRPNLKILLAHSGAALPLLSSRLASCVAHDPKVQSRLQNDPRFYLGKFYYDAVAYGPEELEFVSKVIGRSQRFKRGGIGASGTPAIGSEELKKEIDFATSRFVFGTDHPFFPPVGKEVEESSREQQPWRSVSESLTGINSCASWAKEERAKVMSKNALEIFGLEQ